MCRFGGVLHDWPESYFKAQQSKGGGLAGVFKQAMDQQQAGKISRSRSILSRMFPNSPLARLKSLTVCHAMQNLGLPHISQSVYTTASGHTLSYSLSRRYDMQVACMFGSIDMSCANNQTE